MLGVLLIALVLGIGVIVVITMLRIYRAVKRVSFQLDETFFWLDNAPRREE